MSRQPACLALLLVALVVAGAAVAWWLWPDENVRVPIVADELSTRATSVPERSAAPQSAPEAAAEVIEPAPAPEAFTPEDAEFRVIVLLPDGSVAPDAHVHWVRRGSEYIARRDFIPPALTVRLARAAWVLGATRGDGNDALDAEIDLDAADPEAETEIRLELKPMLGGVKGKLVPPPGFSRLPPHVVKLEPGAHQALPEVTREKLRELQRNPGAGSGGDFEFLFRKPGPYRLVALSTSGDVLAFKDITLDRTVQAVELHMAELHRPDFIVARVLGPDGGLMSDLTFLFGRGSEGLISNNKYEPLCADDGSYWFARSVIERDAYFEKVQRYDLTFISASLGRRYVSYSGGDSHEIEVRFEPLAYATITLTNAATHPVREKLSWGLRPAVAGLRPSSSRTYSLQGGATSFRFGPEQPVDYDLVHWCKSSSNTIFELGLTRIKLDPGENAIAVEIPMVYAVTVTFDPARTEAVSLNGADRTRSLGFSSFDPAAGPATVGPLPAGTYHLFDGKGSVTFEVPGQLQVHFNPPPYDAWRIEGVPPGGRVEALGLREGDIVVAFDGAEITNAALQDPVAESAKRQSTTWTVLRDGARVNVTFNGADLARIRAGSHGLNAERVRIVGAYRNPP